MVKGRKAESPVIDNAILHEHATVELYVLPEHTVTADNAAFHTRAFTDTRRLAHQAVS